VSGRFNITNELSEAVTAMLADYEAKIKLWPASRSDTIRGVRADFAFLNAAIIVLCEDRQVLAIIYYSNLPA
jgi:hypothetical protein